MKTATFLFNHKQSGPQRLHLEGNLDEATTMAVHAYPPYPDFLAPTFTPLQSITVTNTGPHPIAGLRVMAGRSQTPWSMAEIVEEVTAGFESDRHRIRALFEFIGQRFHFGQDPESLHVESAVSFSQQDHPWGFYPGYDYLRSRETYSVLRQLHCYGSGNCVTAGLIFNALCEAAGYKTRMVHLRDHFVSEVFHDGQWRMYDPLCRVVVARQGLPLSTAEIHANPHLARGLRWHYPANTERTRSDQTFGNRPGKLDDDLDLFSRCNIYDSGFPKQETRLDFVLHPRDQITWWPRFQGRFHTWLTPNLYNWIRPPQRVASGVLRRKLLSDSNQRVVSGIRLPYPIVGGRLTASRKEMDARLVIAGAGESLPLRFIQTSTGWTAGLEPVLAPLQTSAIHHLELVLEPGPVQSSVLEIDFQVHPDALPGLLRGPNTIAVTADSPNPALELVLAWEERSAPRPAAPDGAQVAPGADGHITASCAEASTPVELYHFRIRAADDPFAVAGYGFERLTPGPKARLAGWNQLARGRRYQLQVRVKADDGPWGPWGNPLFFES